MPTPRIWQLERGFLLHQFQANKLFRSTDTLGRWGGEEFLLILPDTTIDAAVATVRRMRAATAEMTPVDAECNLRVTFSAGIASRSGTAAESEVLQLVYGDA